MKHLLIVLSVGFSLMCMGQHTSKYWVELTDKTNTPFSLNNPKEFLSWRALDRRVKLGVAVDVADLPVDPDYVKQIAAMGAQVLYRSKWFNALTITSEDSTLPARLLQLNFVKKLDTLCLFTDSVKAGERDLRDVLPWHFMNVKNETLGFEHDKQLDTLGEYEKYGLLYDQANMIAVDYLHDRGYYGEGLVIAVFDAGFKNVDKIEALSHLWEDGQLLGWRDFVSPGGDIFSVGTHGTMVLSIMAARQYGVGVGTAPEASYWLLRTEDAPTEGVIEECNWVAAAEFADSVGVDLINSSLGYTTFDDVSQNHTYEDMDGRTALVSRAANKLASKGVLIVNSAGNSARKFWQYIGAPADADSVLAIGAVDRFGEYAYFSSVGPTSDGRVKPNVSARGLNTYLINSRGVISQANGTSLSSPVVCGASACLWQKYPELTNLELKKVIEQSANQYNTPDSLCGHGIPNYCKASLHLDEVLCEYDVFVVNTVFSKSLDVLVDNDRMGHHAYRFLLRNQKGEVVYEKVMGSGRAGVTYFRLNELGELASGIYLFELSADHIHITKTVIKIR